MTLFLLLVAVLVVTGIVSTVRELRLDRPREVPRSRYVDPALQPPAARGSHV